MKVIVVGGGRTAIELARQLDDDEVVLITEDADQARAAATALDIVVVAGDPTDRWVLEDAGAHDADVLVALDDADRRNLMAAQIARRLGVRRVVAVVHAPESRAVFAALGIHAVVSAAEVLASLVRQQSEFDGVLTALALHRGRLSVLQLRLPDDSPAVGCSLTDLPLPKGALVIALVRADEVSVPNGAMVLCADDEILVAVHKAAQDEALSVLLGAS